MRAIKIAYKIIFLSFIFFNFESFSTDILIEGKENIPPISSSSKVFQSLPISEIKDIQREIEKSHQTANFKELLKVHAKFKELNYKESQWEEIAEQLKIYKWSNQNWRQTVGGHLFYPTNVPELLDSPYTEHLLKRTDMIWAFAIAAYYRHPLGQYYLAKTLNTIRSNYTDADRPKFFNELFKTSLTTLFSHLDHNDACYALGRSKVEYPYIGDDFIKVEPFDIFNKGTNFRNKLEAVYCQDASLLYEEDYLKLGKQGCALAYREAAMCAQNIAEKEHLLQQSADLGYPSALIDLGHLYKKKEDHERAIKYYQDASEKGIAEGHIQYGICLVGDVVSNLEELKKDLSDISANIIEEATDRFALAGKSNNPRGWEYLFALKRELYKKTKSQALKKDFYDALVEGIKLGSDTAYHNMHLYFPKKNHPETFSSLVNTYGYPPQERLYKQIKSYWKTL
jgi:hypothetical protein